MTGFESAAGLAARIEELRRQLREQMNSFFEAVEKQQSGKTPGSRVWCIGEDVKQLGMEYPQYTAIMMEDLKADDRLLEKIEQKLKAEAGRKHKESKGDVVMGPKDLIRIMKETFGLPAELEKPAGEEHAAGAEAEFAAEMMDFASLFGEVK